MAWVTPGVIGTGNPITTGWLNKVNGDLNILETQVGLSGTGPALLGAVPATTAPNFKIQAASTVGTTSSGGLLAITFPSTFPTGVLTVTAGVGDNNLSLGQVQVLASTISISGFTVGCLDTSGASINTGGVRVNWLAVGY